MRQPTEPALCTLYSGNRQQLLRALPHRFTPSAPSDFTGTLIPTAGDR